MGKSTTTQNVFSNHQFYKHCYFCLLVYGELKIDLLTNITASFFHFWTAWWFVEGGGGLGHVTSNCKKSIETSINKYYVLKHAWWNCCSISRETELRQRQTQVKKDEDEAITAKEEKNEYTREWVISIVQKSLIVIGICAIAFLAYRYFRYSPRAPRAAPPPRMPKIPRPRRGGRKF